MSEKVRIHEAPSWGTSSGRASLESPLGQSAVEPLCVDQQQAQGKKATAFTHRRVTLTSAAPVRLIIRTGPLGMVIFIVILGVLIGALAGNFFGAIVGGLIGFGVAKVLKGSDKKKPTAPSTRASTPAAPLPTQDSTSRIGILERRVQSLEAQVGSLQRTVEQLQQGAIVQTVDAAVPEVVPLSSIPPSVAPATPLESAPAAPAQAAEVQPPSSIRVELAEPSVTEEAPVAFHVPQAEPITSVITEQAVPIDSPWPIHSESAQAEQSWPDEAQAPRRGTQATPRLAPPPSQPRSFKDHIPERLRPLIFGGNTIVKVGVLILFLGLSFLLRYVAEQVTVPIELRYAGVALMGAAMLGLGWRLRAKTDASGSTDYGLILQGAGIGVFYLTTLAAMKLHPLLPVAVGVALIVLITAFASLLAVAQNAPWLAMVASAAGFATPVLVSTGQGNHIALFSYLAILDLGIMGMAWFRAWRPLNLIGFFGTFGLAAAWAAKGYKPEFYAGTQAFLLLFFVMFTVIGVLFARRALAQGDEPNPAAPLGARATTALKQLGRVDSTLVFGVPLAAYGLQYQMVRDDPWLPALSALAFGIFYVLLGAWLWRGKQARYALLAEAYVVVGVLFGTLSVPLALEGTWTGATWAVEAAGMYWLGTRQHRSYTRAFATALMTGAALRMLQSLGWSDVPEQPFLTGSVMGMVLLAGSALSMAWVHRQAKAAAQVQHASWEPASASFGWYLSVASVATLPWILLMPLWASVLMAGMALGSLWIGRRILQEQLQVSAKLLHAAAIAGFASTLHQQDGQAMLANGVQGMTAALLIGASLLATAWLGLRDTWRQATSATDAADQAPAWPQGSSIALMLGLGLMSGALLFLMPMEQAALIWPVLALGMLWLGLKLAHPALSAMWALLSVVSALAFMSLGPAVWPDLNAMPVPANGFGPLGGLAWWTPLVLVLCTATAAAWLHTASTRERGWRMPWVSSGWTQRLMLAAVLWWWAQTLPPEILRWLQLHQQLSWISASMSLWVTLTSILMLQLARWRQWSLMGQAAALTIPMWIASSLVGPLGQGQPPLTDLGWLAWPIALLWHPAALRQNARWWPHQPQSWMHVGGLWFFAVLAFRELQWATDQWAAAGTAWQALGWLIVPVALTTAMSLPALHRRWPLRDFAMAYRVTATLPMAAALLGWLLWSAFNAGHAAPLPYVPVLNPLEIGQGLVVLTLLRWLQALPEGAPAILSSRKHQLMVLGGLGFLMLTTMVLRACHHWAGVPWSADALMASRLAQAALSVTWALLGVGLMVIGHRRVKRIIWALGAGLLAVVVAKLFFVELADHGSLYRIVSFIVVGLLLLIVGYFAPVPPQESPETTGPLKEAA